MAILNFGDHLPPVYLERFNPPENQAVRISVLSLQVVGVESHWVDLPTLGIKGMYRCTGGVCCSSGAFGRRSQYYHLPVYVYNNPNVSAEGQLMDWSLTKTVYDSLVQTAQVSNLLEYDLSVIKTVQGQGTRTNFTIVPEIKMRAYWTPEQAQKINESVQMFFQIAESTLVQEANDQIYMDMLTQAGYNFETHQFPAIPASNYHGANVAISQAVVPPMGIGQRAAPAMGLPNAGGFPGAQSMGMPTPPQIGNPQVGTGSPIPPQTGSPAPLSTGIMPQIQSASPTFPQTGSPTQPSVSTGTSQPFVQNQPAQVAVQSAAPGFGQMPQASVPPTPPQFTQQPVPQASFQTMQPQGTPAVPGNTIPQGSAKELSEQDIDALLGEDE